ncbi:LOW QUALITY PROTEIN: myeloid-associated differentiation marker homolog [Phoenicopterus ruber ruber]
MAMAKVNTRAVTSWVGIARLFAVVLSCLAFSLVASTGNMYWDSYWTWCMFTWCFCFTVTLLVLVLELLGLYPKLPLSWDDFTSAFSMLAALMIFTTSVVFPSIFIRSPCSGSVCARRAVATTASCLCFLAYVLEVGLTRAKPGDISSFLSTVPGLQVFEAYVACLIFSLLDGYGSEAGLRWCVAVYSICFIITLLIIIFTIGRCLTYIPCPLEKMLVGYSALALVMYITATVLWPLYNFHNKPRPNSCNTGCSWDKQLGVTFLTIFNLIAYLVDLIYSTRMVFIRTPA